MICHSHESGNPVFGFPLKPVLMTGQEHVGMTGCFIVYCATEIGNVLFPIVKSLCPS